MKIFLFIFSIFIYLHGYTNEDFSNNSLDTINVTSNKATLSLLKAVHFLLSDGKIKPDRDALLVTNYINTKYGVYIPYPTTDTNINKMPLNSSNLISYSRWYNPNYIINKDTYKKYKHHQDSLLIASLYSDKFKLPKNYLNELDKMSLEGGYYLTHACLYLQLSINNNSNIKKTKEFNRVNEAILTRLDSFINHPKQYLYDVDIEAIAIKTFLNQPMKNLWITQIINSQELDGGWKAHENDPVISAHTTSLAIWALVDYLKNKPISTINITNLTAEQQFVIYYLAAINNSDTLLITPKDLLSLSEKGKSSNMSTIFLFDSLYSKYEQLYTKDLRTSIDSIINNDDTLAYFLFSYDRWNKEKKLLFKENFLEYIKRNQNSFNDFVQSKVLIILKIINNKTITYNQLINIFIEAQNEK